MSQLQDFQHLVLDALEVVEFKLIRSRSDLENNSMEFHPSMAHQIFGPAENIFGYEDLKVRLLYTAGPMYIYLGVEYSKKVDELTNGDIRADDIVATIAQKLPDGCYFVNMDEFLKTLDMADKFQPFGEKINEYKCQDNDGKERTFEFYNSNYTDPSFLRFFSRLQTFVLWFVDAASYIDIDDPLWKYFICYEKYKNDNGEELHATVGYSTVYEYYAYPQNIRPRISQMLVLPPFQRLGIGTKFLETIYKVYQNTMTVVDITVEVPSDDFQRMRNLVDARRCINLTTFQREEIKRGYNSDMVKEARETLKINPLQCRRVYEIIRLLYTDKQDADDYKSYRLAVKNRLNSLYSKQLCDIQKMEQANVDCEWLRAQLPSKEVRLKQLHEEYKQVEKEYEHILEKLNAE